MLVWTARTSLMWHLPHVSLTTRRSPGFTKRIYSGDSFSQSDAARTGLAEVGKSFGNFAFGCARFFAVAYSDWLAGFWISALPPWQSTQESWTVPVVCIVGES